MSNIGMMDGAFFVGRKEIMDWVNGTLELNLSKVEDTCNGAVACQLLDIMYPNQVPMHKINWAANKTHEYVANYKILQDCFSKLHIERFIDVARLTGGRYMDNLEFMQWFKRFFEMTCAGKPSNYDAAAQRNKGKGASGYGGVAKSKPSSAPSVSKPVVSKPSAAAKPTSAASNVTQKENKAPAASPAKTASNNNVHINEINVLKSNYNALNQSYEEMKCEIGGIEKERDFYFEKLREIEVLLQEEEDKGNGTPLSAAIFKILYATADGFEPLVNDVAAIDVESSAILADETY